MNLFGKISIFIWLIILIAFSIMFDWFGARDIAESGLEALLAAVESLSSTGDHIEEAMDMVADETAPAREAVQEGVEETVEKISE